ncbi:acyltransferase family protein [Aurantiacibacter sp. MUD61]|uniref:acyltransferase family protein n=1 Tax=Aurantiacibacter sp. MUD61 TaxID=3009083 RepID=UPI0022F0268E|nr:acyltransferase family protein [Aurantiacibacter sp. MUD61]
MTESRPLSASQKHRASAIAYRPEIDGLRAIAVLAVILFHAGIPGFSGGFVGVDVFFVISGFLITSIIGREIADGEFSLSGFYERRVRRILPALFFYAAFAAVLTIWLYPPHFLKQFGQSLAALALLASNILFIRKTDYFNDFQETAPLLHTWSLSVEEQYYLIAPLLLMLLLRRSRMWALAGLAVLAFASLVHAQVMLEYSATFSFYSVTTRFWELAVGGCLALAAQNWRLPAANPLVALAGLIMIGWAVVSYDPLIPFPGLSAALPVLGCALIIAFSHGRSLSAQILGLRWLVWIGLVSYSWYLSHYMIFAVARSLGYELGANALTFGLIGVSLVMAIATYVLIEQPARKAVASRKTVFGLALAASAGLAALGMTIHFTDGLRDFKHSRLSPEMRETVLDVETAQRSRRADRSRIMSGARRPFADDDLRKVVVLGDSLAIDFYVATQFGDFAETQFRYTRMDDECMAASFEDAPMRQRCQRTWGKLRDLGFLESADEIVLVANWNATTTSNVADFAQMLEERGKAVTVVGPADFTHASSLSYNMARRGITGEETERVMFDNMLFSRDRFFRTLEEELQRRGVAFRTIEKRDAFCAMAEQRCALIADGEWLIFDRHHLTAAGYRHVGQRMRPLGWFR